MKIGSMLISMIILITHLLTWPVSAQWMSQEIEDPFGTNHITGALTAKSGKGLIIRCIGGKRLELMFMPNEKGSSDTAATANALGVNVLLRIDKDPIDQLKATVNASDNALVAIANIEPALANRIANAKRRVAAVIETMGQKFGTVSFGVRGSSRHISRVTKACAETQGVP